LNKYKNNDIVLGKMNAIHNEIEGLMIGSFPTMIFYPANSKINSIVYQGEKTVTDML